MDQITRWQQPADWVQHLTNCNWQSDLMILTLVRDHSQLTLVHGESWVFGPDSIHLRVLPAASPRG
eukprot:5555349-Prymnesium_polylepis.1